MPAIVHRQQRRGYFGRLGQKHLVWLLRMVALVWLGASATGAAAQVETESNTDSFPAFTETLAHERQTDDREIDARLTRILIASGWFRAPRVEVREGIVFLDGRTTSDENKAWAGTLAAKIEDVVAVVNRIEIQPEISWDFSPALDEMRLIALKAQQALPLLVLGVVILIVTWQATRLASAGVSWALRDRIASPLMLMVASRAFAVPVFVVGLYLVLQIFGLTRLAITVLGGTGLIGIALGFAFRDIAENFLASLLLSIRNPFRAGDYIRLGEYEGNVKNLNTRTTVLLTADGNHVQIPNATVFKSVITNFSSNPSRRAEFSVGIGYDDPTSTAQEIIEHVLSSHPAVREDPDPFVVVDELAPSTVNLKCYFWFDSTIYSPAKLRSALMRQTKQALLDGGISMPDEAREVIFPQGLPIFRKASEKSEEKGAVAPLPTLALTPSPSEADTSTAEGGLDNEEDDVMREAGAAKSPDEKENLLGDERS